MRFTAAFNRFRLNPPSYNHNEPLTPSFLDGFHRASVTLWGFDRNVLMESDFHAFPYSLSLSSAPRRYNKVRLLKVTAPSRKIGSSRRFWFEKNRELKLLFGIYEENNYQWISNKFILSSRCLAFHSWSVEPCKKKTSDRRNALMLTVNERGFQANRNSGNERVMCRNRKLKQWRHVPIGCVLLLTSGLITSGTFHE